MVCLPSMKRRKVILPCAYLPPLEYFTYLTGRHEPVIEVHEHYRKQTYRNRCLIAGAGGQLALSVPVIKTHGNHTRVKDLLISYQQKWQRVHWGAITAAYSASPFFFHYRDILQPYYEKKTAYLIDLNLGLTTSLMKCLGLEGPFAITSGYEAAPQDALDLRLLMSPKKEMKMNFLPYKQVFDSNTGFIPGMSIIDLLFNLGPDSRAYLLDLTPSP
jgi:hypothetical protein